MEKSVRWAPRATVATVVERNGLFLMVEELSHGQTVLNQPAGHLEPNESLIQAAHRETLEETAWEVEIQYLLGLYTYKSHHNGVTYHRMTFVGEALHEHKHRVLDPVIQATHWLSYDQLRQGHFKLRSPMVLRVIEDYLKGVRYPLDFIKYIDQ